jgi:hypothetical protein
MTTIQDAYISVELKSELLKGLRHGLKSMLNEQGVRCENASPEIHVSIAYGKGHVEVGAVQTAAETIAKQGFSVTAKGFEIFEGLSTPFDYLVVELETQGDIEDAIEVAQGNMEIKRFGGGFKSHVSLLRFEKGSLESSIAREMVREMNASQGAASALGYCMCLKGECVCVFNPQRECCLQVAIAA